MGTAGGHQLGQSGEAQPGIPSRLFHVSSRLDLRWKPRLSVLRCGGTPGGQGGRRRSASSGRVQRRDFRKIEEAGQGCGEPLAVVAPGEPLEVCRISGCAFVSLRTIGVYRFPLLCGTVTFMPLLKVVDKLVSWGELVLFFGKRFFALDVNWRVTGSSGHR